LLLCRARPLVLRPLVRAFASKVPAPELASLRLVCDQGKSLGIMPPADAQKIASERSLFLVEVSSAATPPVWKLMVDEPQPQPEEPPPSPQQKGKKQQQQQKPSKGGKAEKAPKVKEVRLTDRCDARDTETKAANALKFLGKGHEVKVIALNTGRRCEETKKAMAQVLVERICEACAEVADRGDIGGRTSTSGAPASGKQILGMVAATLTPKGGASRAPPTPRREKKQRNSREQ